MEQRVIYKYAINSNVTTIRLPESSVVLDIQYQNGKPYLWAEVPVYKGEKQEDVEEWPRDKLFPLDITMVGTGVKNMAKLFDVHTYFKTLQDGPFVWHFYLNDVHSKFNGISSKD